MENLKISKRQAQSQPRGRLPRALERADSARPHEEPMNAIVSRLERNSRFQNLKDDMKVFFGEVMTPINTCVPQGRGQTPGNTAPASCTLGLKKQISLTAHGF